MIPISSPMPCNRPLTFPESERTFTQAFMRYQRKDFKSFDLDTSQGIKPTRDANNWMLGAMQYWRFSDDRGHVRAGYTFDADQTGSDVALGNPAHTGADWSYTGHRFSTGVAYKPLAATTLQLAFDYYRQNYSNPNSFSPDLASPQRQRLSIDRYRHPRPQLLAVAGLSIFIHEGSIECGGV